jgi:hypothetical protein
MYSLGEQVEPPKTQSGSPGPVHEGGDKRQRSSNFFLTDVVVGWKVTGLPLTQLR